MKQQVFFLFFLFTFALLNAIQVSGNQSGIWSPDNNPYEVVGDVRVLVGTTLTVQPGVIVQAMGHYQIIVVGNIIANGTEQDSIRFVSGQADSTALWKGIRLTNLINVQSQFSHCRFERGEYGIEVFSSTASITYCHFNNNIIGISAEVAGTNLPTILIDHNLVENSDTYGILTSERTYAIITNNELRYNGLIGAGTWGAVGVYNQVMFAHCSPTIAYNHIHDNYRQGINIVSYNVTYVEPVVHDNLIENNHTGIRINNSNGVYYNNTIVSNFIPDDTDSGDGICITGGYADPYFQNNYISGNYRGFYLVANANPVIGDLSSDSTWAQGGNTITDNIDADNVRRSIVCEGFTIPTFTIKAENNTWDFDTDAEIGSTITDFYDNTALPNIDYDPWNDSTSLNPECDDLPDCKDIVLFYPNPFTKETRLSFEVKTNLNCDADISIFNLKGQLVKTMKLRVNKQGKYEAIWDGTDLNRNPVSNGIYIYTIKLDKYIQTGKTTFIK